jgi:hypothetical protein
MLHRLRAVLVRPDLKQLSGTVEVDETFIGGQEPGLRGGPAEGKQILTAIAVELIEPRGFGRFRLAPRADPAAVPDPHAGATACAVGGWRTHVAAEQDVDLAGSGKNGLLGLA